MAQAFPRHLLRSRYVLSSAFAAVTVSSAVAIGTSSNPSHSLGAEANAMLRTATTSDLISTWIVYKSCQLPWLVNSSQVILDSIGSVWGLRQISHAVVRATFFQQFVGGDTAENCLAVMRRLRGVGVGTLLNYSVEAEQGDDDLAPALVEIARENVRETIRAIEVCGQENKRLGLRPNEVGSAWIAIKLTGLTDPEVLLHASNAILNLRAARSTLDHLTAYPGSADDEDAQVMLAHTEPSVDMHTQQLPGPTTAELASLRVLYEDMRDILRKASEHGVRVLMDAEQSWYQPVTDVFTLLLAQEFNRRDSLHGNALPILYWTFQGYLRRNLEHLQRSFDHAEKHDYTIGAKLVRGAYQEQEFVHWQTIHGKDSPPPVWTTKLETDACYNAALDFVLDKVEEDVRASEKGGAPRVGLLAATHNVQSAEHLVEELKRRGLATPSKSGVLMVDEDVRKRVCLGQLYGMSDDLTSWIASRFSSDGAPMVLKYVPYGALAQVMPYLSRRAIENKSVLSGERGAKLEADQAWGELSRRWFGLRA